jgi:hypothetical protein
MLLRHIQEEIMMQSNGEVGGSRKVPAAFAFMAVTALVTLLAIRPAQAQDFAAAVQWMSLGPAGSQIGSGKLNAFAQVSSNPKVMYIGGGWGNTPRESPSQSGVYGTTDGGQTWKTLDNGLTNPDGTISSVVNGLWLDQSNPSVLLASTEFGGTFRSTNGGKKWTNVDLSESTQFAETTSKLYLASRRGILVSADRGATWNVSLPVTAGATTVVTAGGATFAGTTSGDIYRLKSGAWTKTGHPGSGPVHDLAVDPFNSKVVYANVDDVSAWNENLYGSIDGGHTWSFINCNCSIGAQAIAFSLVVPNRLYLGDDGSGVIFYFIADGNPNPRMSFGAQPYGVDMRYIVALPGQDKTDDACMLLMDQGLFYAAHCTSGFAPPLDENVPNTLAYDVKVTPNGQSATVPLQDNSAANSVDGGKSWIYTNAANAGEGGESFIDPTDPSHCYFAHPDSGLWVSLDGCASYSGPVTDGIESLTFDPAVAGKMYAITGADINAQVSVSTNAGNTWSPAPWQFTNPYQIVVSPADAKTIIVATGTATSPPILYYTHDGGTTWKKATGLPQQVQRNQTIYYPTHRLYATFEPNVAKTVLLTDHEPSTDNVMIFRSVDNAKTFSHIKTFLQPVPPRPWPFLLFPNSHERIPKNIPYYATRFFANRLAFNPQPPTGSKPAVVLTTRFGAYVSYDVGTKWKRIDTLAIAHHFIGVDWNGGYVFLSSFGQGVIRSAVPLQ